jgi:hypothetical protein
MEEWTRTEVVNFAKHAKIMGISKDPGQQAVSKEQEEPVVL